MATFVGCAPVPVRLRRSPGVCIFLETILAFPWLLPLVPFNALLVMSSDPSADINNISMFFGNYPIIFMVIR